MCLYFNLLVHFSSFNFPFLFFFFFFYYWCICSFIFLLFFLCPLVFFLVCVS
jgi:hypothetical protein